MSVGDPGAKGVKPGDMVVVDIVQFPSERNSGQGVISEVLGDRGKAGVDTQTVIVNHGLPTEFPEAAMKEAETLLQSVLKGKAVLEIPGELGDDLGSLNDASKGNGDSDDEIEDSSKNGANEDPEEELQGGVDVGDQPAKSSALSSFLGLYRIGALLAILLSQIC